KYQDKRLVEPLVKLVELKDPNLTPLALPLLAGYEDRRIVPLAVEHLGDQHRQFYGNPAVAVLVKQPGPEVVPFLAKRFQEGKDGAGAAHALGNLVAHAAENWQSLFQLREQVDKAVADVRKAAVEPLLAGLKDKSPRVQAAVAEALMDVTSRQYGGIVDFRA